MLNFSIKTKNKPLYQFARKCHYFLKKQVYRIDLWYRKTFDNSKYNKIAQLKNSYAGKRCFIVATGPSLTLEDLDKIKNEYSFSMNSAVRLFDRTDWRPDFYGCQDCSVYEQMRDNISSFHPKYKFMGSSIKLYFKIPEDCIEFPLDLMDHMYNFTKLDTDFSEDCSLNVFDGYTITYSLIQIAVYMGFDEIYLLGTDCDYSGKAKHIVEYDKFNIAHEANVSDRLMYAYAYAEKYTKQHNVKIYNATRGGKLEAFERFNLDNLQSNKAKQKFMEG